MGHISLHSLVWGNKMNTRAIALTVACILSSTTFAQATFDKTPFNKLTAPDGAFAIVALLQEHGTTGVTRQNACTMLLELDGAYRALDLIADEAYALEQKLFSAVESGSAVASKIDAYNDVAEFLDKELVPAHKALLASRVIINRYLAGEQKAQLQTLAQSLKGISRKVRAERRKVAAPKMDTSSFVARLFALAKGGTVAKDNQQHA